MIVVKQFLFIRETATLFSMTVLLPKDSFGCPYLLLAPMEGVGDHFFRKAIASIGGFDESVRDFLRVPKNAHIKSLASKYDPHEITPFPLACQIMGSDLELMAEMAQEVERLGAKRIDVNCGCPSNQVTGRGAGSSLLKEPDFLFQVAQSVVKAVSIPVTVKMRSGFDDTSLFKENLLAAEQSGISYLTLHPRTKVDGYGPPADWKLIALAKSIVKIPVVGNGDILTVADALLMLSETGCDALMIGRGALINPFIFHEVRASFSNTPYVPSKDALERYIRLFASLFASSVPMRTRVNKQKQLLGFLFKGSLEKREKILTAEYDDATSYLEYALSLL